MSDVRVLTPTVHQVEGRNSHVTYVVDVKSLSAHVSRRYSDFQWLYSRIMIEVPGAFILSIPHKRTALMGEGQFSSDFLEERRRNLDIFFRGVTSVPNISQICPSLTAFLGDAGKNWEATKKQAEAANPDIASTSLPSGNVQVNEATVADAKKGLGNLMAKAKTVAQTKFGDAELRESKKENEVKAIKLYYERMEHQVKDVVDQVVRSLTPPQDNPTMEIKMVHEKQSLLASLKHVALDISCYKGALKRRKKLQTEFTTKRNQLEQKKKNQSKPPKQKFGFSKKPKDPAKVAAELQELEKSSDALQGAFESTSERILREASRCRHGIESKLRSRLKEAASIQMKCGGPVSVTKAIPQFPDLGEGYEHVPTPAPAAATPPSPARGKVPSAGAHHTTSKTATSPAATGREDKAAAPHDRNRTKTASPMRPRARATSPVRATPVNATRSGARAATSPVRSRGNKAASPVRSRGNKATSPVRAKPVNNANRKAKPVMATATSSGSGKPITIALPDANTSMSDWFKNTAPMITSHIKQTTPIVASGGKTRGGGRHHSPYGGNPYGKHGGGTAVPPVDNSHFTAPFEDLYPNADPARWRLTEMRFKGKAKYYTKGLQKKYEGPIPPAIEMFKASPQRFVAIMYQHDMLEEWDPSEHKYTLLHRKDTIGWKPIGPVPEANLICIMHTYERCRFYPNNSFPMEIRDKYTDKMTYRGRLIHNGRSILPIMPGRGMGCVDLPNLKLMAKVKPGDIQQGSVGDCWLLSGISAVAEFEGAIENLFRKNHDPQNLPTDEPNVYTVTLWDLRTWSEVDIVIDERLCANPDGKKMLLGAKPSKDGQLWVPYLEKAIAVLCGGYDKIEGGQCTHAWPILTGIKEQYTIQNKSDANRFGCYGRFNSRKNSWSDHENSPQDGDQTIWRMPWPLGDDSTGDISMGELFHKMSIWSDANYLMGAGTKGDSDSNTTNGLVDDHAYSIVKCVHHVAGTDVNLVQVRNPWGKGEIEDGEFADGGPGWRDYPDIEDLLQPTASDDGLFWMTEKEFFQFFERVFLCAADMKEVCGTS